MNIRTTNLADGAKHVSLVCTLNDGRLFVLSYYWNVGDKVVHLSRDYHSRTFQPGSCFLPYCEYLEGPCYGDGGYGGISDVLEDGMPGPNLVDMAKHYERADHAQTLAASATSALANAEWIADEEEGHEVRSILIFDGGSRGWRIGEAVIDLAREYGYDPGACDCSNEATSYLNDLLREGGSSAYFTQDEDFFLQESRDVSCSFECLDCLQPEKFCVCSEERERASAVDELLQEADELRIKEGERCPQCSASVVSYGSARNVFLHEAGCPVEARLNAISKQIERLEDSY